MSSFRQTGAPSSGFWSIERVVTILTPVFGALAAWLTAWVGKHFPGMPHINATDVTALEIAGFSGAVAAALKWLHGRQKFTQVAGDVDRLAEQIAARVQHSAAGPAVGEIEDLLKQNRDQIVQGLAGQLGASPKVEEIAQEVVRRLVGAQQQAAVARPTP